MSDNVITLVDVLIPPNSIQSTYAYVPLADVAANVADKDAYPADFVARLGDEGVRRPLLLTAADGSSPPYRALTERHLIPAFRQAGLKQIPAVVIPPERIQAGVTALAARFQSTDDVLERAWICDTLTRVLHESQDQIADRLNTSRWTLRRYQSLLDLPPTLLRLLMHGQLGLSHVLACTKAPIHRQEDIALAVAQYALSRQQTVALVDRVQQSPDALLPDLLEEMLGSGPQPRAEATESSRSENEVSSTEEAPEPETASSGAETYGIDLTRYTSQLQDRRREALERLAQQMQLDPLTIRRAALLLIADPRLVVPSAVAYAQHVSCKELGRAVAQMELAVARMRSAATEGVTPNERKVLELVLHHVPLWAEELMFIIQDTPTSVAAGSHSEQSAPGRSRQVN